MNEKMIENIYNADPFFAEADFSEIKSIVNKTMDFLDDKLDDKNIKSTIYIMILIKLLQNKITYNINRQMKALELTSSQFDIILFLICNDDENKEINQKDIEHKFNLTNPTVTGLLKRLELKGFIKRYPSEHDARFKRIVLTEKSQLIKNNMYDSFSEYSKLFFSGITEKEKAALMDILIKLNHNIGLIDHNGK